MGYFNLKNICDIVVFRYGKLLLLECKSFHSSTFNFKSSLPDTDNDKYQDLIAADSVRGVFAGYMMWAVERQRTFYVPAPVMHKMRAGEFKSFNVNEYDKGLYDSSIIELEGRTKRVFTEYNLSAFFSELSD
jgi:hypothetical protein